jgi:hypothetical protein
MRCALARRGRGREFDSRSDQSIVQPDAGVPAYTPDRRYRRTIMSCKISALLSGLACLDFLAAQKQNFDNSMVFKWESRRWKAVTT